MRASIVAVLLLGTAALVWQGGGEIPPSSPEATESGSFTSLEAGVLAGLPKSAVGRRSAEPPVEGIASAVEAGMEAETASFGSVRGILVDADGAPVPHTVVLLRRGVGVSEKRCSSMTDSEGLFYFAEVPAGSWQAGALLTPQRGQASAVSLQSLEVVAEQRAWVDLWLAGSRAIRGRILLEEDGLPQDMVFEVEARPLLQPDRVISDTIAAEDAAEVFEPMPSRAERERRVMNEFLEENPGVAPPQAEQIAEWADELAAELESARVAEGAVFSLGGLAPGRYALRIYLDVARERWAALEADLSEGDAEFGLLRLRFADFPLRVGD